MLEDVPLCLMFLPIMLRHLCTFLLIVANSRWSALGSGSGVWQTHDIDTLCILITLFIIPHFFHHSIIWLRFLYIDTHPTLAGLHPFLLKSPARCIFLSYYMYIYYLGSPAISQLICSHSCPNRFCLLLTQWNHSWLHYLPTHASLYSFFLSDLNQIYSSTHIFGWPSLLHPLLLYPICLSVPVLKYFSCFSLCFSLNLLSSEFRQRNIGSKIRQGVGFNL